MKIKAEIIISYIQPMIVFRLLYIKTFLQPLPNEQYAYTVFDQTFTHRSLSLHIRYEVETEKLLFFHFFSFLLRRLEMMRLSLNQQNIPWRKLHVKSLHTSYFSFFVVFILFSFVPYGIVNTSLVALKMLSHPFIKRCQYYFSTADMIQRQEKFIQLPIDLFYHMILIPIYTETITIRGTLANNTQPTENPSAEITT